VVGLSWIWGSGLNRNGMKLGEGGMEDGGADWSWGVGGIFDRGWRVDEGFLGGG
jgi:hypothetical protein